MSKVSINEVIKKYGEVLAVDSLNLEFEDGKFTVLVGPSGCGKTTTLRMIAGLETVTSGTIKIGETDVTKFEPKDRDISMVFQNYALYGHLTVAENIIFPLLARGGNRSSAQPRLKEVAEMLEISNLLARKPKELSGGQQQRVAIGRAIVRAPRVFLFDEPLSNLDAKLRVEMRTELLRLQRQIGTTTVYVTHDQEEAMTLSDVMVVMKDGKILQKGSPIEIYERPVNIFVASFVGSPKMNLIPQGAQILGVRPEDVILSQGNDGAFNAKVEIIELLGPRAIVSLIQGGHRITSVVNISDMSGIREGAEVGVRYRPGMTHNFDAQSGKRIS